MSRPVLWHLTISHYNEKVRWALAYKDVEHDRRAPLPGTHFAVALWLTRGRAKTFPILQVDGKTIPDSTAIIAELERRFPEPALYPDEPAERRRALELEDFFDEEVGPHTRLFAFHETVRDPDAADRLAASILPARMYDAKPIRAGSMRFMETFASVRYGIRNEEAAEQSKRKILAGIDRLESELGESDYLVGDRFTVADLTAASLFYPLVKPAEGPRITELSEAYERFRESLSERRGCRWVAEMFHRHRKRAPEPVSVS